MIRSVLAVFLVAIVASGLGCLEQPPSKVTEVPQPPQQVTHLHIVCGPNQNNNEGIGDWYRDSNDPGGWYQIDENGVKHYGTPPCLNQAQVPSAIPTSRAELGLVPNESGNVSPMIWALDHEPAHSRQYSIDDRINLFIAAEADWLMPFHSDENLRTAIGEENISFVEVDVNDSSRAMPILIGLHQIRLEEAIRLLTSMGATEIEVEFTSSVKYKVALNDTPETYTGAIVSQGEQIVSEFDLR